MNVFGAALRHEMRRLRRDRAMLWLLLIFSVIAGYAAWQGGAWAADRRLAVDTVSAQATAMREEFMERMRIAAERDPQLPSSTFLAVAIQHFPVLDVSPVAALAVGQADGYPYEAKVHSMVSPSQIFGALGPAIANPAAFAIGYLDLAFVVVTLVPLFLLIATFDLWAQERDLGTSGLVLSQPVQPAAILAAKALVRGGGALFALTAICLVALACVVDWRNTPPLTYLQVASVIVLYGVVWIALAVAINVLCRRATDAALACGAAWLILVILLPALLSATHSLRATPSAVSYMNQLRALELDMRDRPRESRRRPVDNASAKDRADDLRMTLKNTQAEHAEYERVTSAYEALEADSRALAQSLRFLSPAVVAQDALERLAGTDADRASGFTTDVRRFLKEIQQHAASRPASEESLPVTTLYEQLPTFVLSKPAGLNAPLWADLGMLLLFGSLPLVVAGQMLAGRRLLRHELGEVS